MRRRASDEQKIERRTYTVPEAAAVAGLGTSAIYKSIREGKIPVLRNGRCFIIPKAAFHQYLDTAGGATSAA